MWGRNDSMMRGRIANIALVMDRNGGANNWADVVHRRRVGGMTMHKVRTSRVGTARYLFVVVVIVLVIVVPRCNGNGLQFAPENYGYLF